MRHHGPMGVKTSDWPVAAALTFAFAAGITAGAVGKWMLIPIAVACAALAASFVWHRRAAPISVTPNVVLIVVPTLLAIPAVINVSGGIAVLAALALLAFGMRPDKHLQLAWPAALLPLVGLVIVGRHPGVAAVAFTAGLVVVGRAVYLSASRLSAVISLLDGIGVFLTASVVLHFAGYGWLDGDKRIIFPLANSQAATPAVAAVYLTAALPVLITNRAYRTLRIVAAGAAVYVLLVADRRTALIAGLAIAVLVLLAPHLLRAAPAIIGAALLAPFIYPHLRGMIGHTVTGAAIMRPGEKADSLNGRDYIWSRSIHYWQHLDDRHQLFGYGPNGHRTSGVSRSYSAMFGSDYGDRKFITPHNSVLQYLFDGGLISATVFVTVVVVIAVVLARRREYVALGMLTALALVGSTEVELSAGQPAWWVLATLGAVAFSRDRSDLRAASSPLSAAMR
jgi:hypothetical protein